jgi:hypothetical protein
MLRVVVAVLCLVTAVAVSAMPLGAHAVEVDLELVLSVDSSGSIDSREFALQREGYARALVHPEVLAAILSGPNKAIALTLVEWSGPGITARVVEWTRIAGKEDAEAVAALLLSSPRTIFGGGTAIGSAIADAVADFDGNGFQGRRRIIDISADGTNNRGVAPQIAREEAIRRGITINGLAIEPPMGGLEAYFRHAVIGGPGAFAIAANGFENFHEAVLRKLLREIFVSEVASQDR